jgi:hypothetical protein
MTAEPKICPCCGQRILGLETGSTDAPDRGAEEPRVEMSAEKADEATQTEAAEYDRRGIRLPRRTRMGGIIVPQ